MKNKDADKLLNAGCRPGGGSQKVCRSRGGESCAFDGAMIVLQPIADAVHIVHGPIGCVGNSWEGRGTLSKKGVFHTMGLTTAMDEMDIIYGAEGKLLEAIMEAHGRLHPQAVFVHSTCVSGLNGEDIDAVCKKAEELINGEAAHGKVSVKVIPVNAPGFIGPKNLGNRIAGEVLLDNVIGTEEPEYTTAFDINLIGEYNIAGDLWQVEPVLEEAGIRVLSRITGDSTFREVAYAHMAKLNLVVCSRALINVARKMERKYGIPYLEVSFFGKTEMAKALRGIAALLDPAGGKGLKGQVEAVIEKAELKLALALEQYGFLKGKRAVLYTGGVKSWSIIQALMDLGIEVAAVGTKKSTFEDEEKMRQILGPDAPLYEDTTPKNLKRLMKETVADVLVAGGRNLYLAVKEGFPFVDVNQERHVPYAGYGGLVNLAADIAKSIRFYGRPEFFHGRMGINRMMPIDLNKTGAAKNALADRPLPLKTDPLKKGPGVSMEKDPLRHSQSLGAAMALQGIDGCLPLIHGAQGCSFLQKVLLTKHFREPIALQSTKLFTEEVVMGSGEKLLSAIRDIMGKQRPGLLAVLTSGLSEIKGDDLESVMKPEMKTGTASSDGKLVLVHTPDYAGGLEDGYRKAVEAVIKGLVPRGDRSAWPDKVRGRINILAGSHLTPADFGAIREIVRSFGLKDPIILPDLSSLDGSRQGLTALAAGGTTVEQIGRMASSEFTIVIGESLEAAASLLRERAGMDYKVLSAPFGLEGTDRLFEMLSQLSGRPVPEKYQRERRMLVDAMRDAHFYLSGKKICLALEPDHAAAISGIFHEMGATAPLAVIPQQPQGNFCRPAIHADEVLVGDFSSMEGYPCSFDLLVSNSHGEGAARRLGVPLYQVGFPVYKKIGYCQEAAIGYRGAASFINGAANRFFDF
ncbi:MAG: nitrogenase iron-molybdenum cofactor biosynthesis protein NifE [Nitrospiraceae bacterium]|nr:nitrogenase iron-molybdenum cofactor biosynthesis protein NifE [Nitrospiraceae bacterium]